MYELYDGCASLTTLFLKYDSVGTIDAGIRAACWAPDDSLVVIITGDDKLLLMTNSFDVLSEGPLNSFDEGEGK